jgi:5'(3')-deoxyribonucleotidase
MKKIYLDMDGVLCNFERRYFERYNELPGSMRDRKDFSVHWDDFVQTKQFETLDWWPEADVLLNFIKSLENVEVEILSSSGGKKYHDEVTEQKVRWLCEKGLPFKANIVAGRKTKAEYATPDTILIDDTYDVIQAFIAAGGIGIHHKEIGNTLLMLEKVLAN